MSQVMHADEHQFNAQLAAPGLLLVDFWAPWCGPCRAIAPILDECARKMPKLRILKINVDDTPEIAQHYQVRGIPTLILFRDGQPIASQVGALSLPQLESWVQSYETAE